MPLGIREFSPPPPKIKSHLSNITSAIYTDNSNRIDEIIQEWRSDSSIPNPMPSDLKLALATAANTDNTSAASALLNAGAEISSLAASNAHSEAMFNTLLAHGWDINSLGISDMPVLRHHVCDPKLLKYLLDCGANPNYTSTNTGLAILDIAAAHAPLANVKLMIEKGADVSKSSALQSAAGAFPDPVPTDEDPEPEDVPAEERLETNDDEMERIPVMQLLLEQGVDLSAIERTHAGPEVVAKVTAPGRKGKVVTVLGTALHRAVRVGAVERVRWLLQNVSDVETKDSAGKTALQLAERLGNRHLCLGLLRESRMKS
ncbi:ankyrin [Lojkania enalia]|uniref:Ankyrin n=1 Tax=Lojkania enalia TaxID=147567 RepID=A0A9P4K9Z7_9PLEO|nr:ankyrin [Didymosphaeria enalia]